MFLHTKTYAFATKNLSFCILKVRFCVFRCYFGALFSLNVDFLNVNLMRQNS